MKEAEYPPLEDVGMDRGCILSRVWCHLCELSCNPDTRLYFYCALELRFCIESIFFELTARVRSNQLTKTDLKTYRPNGFVSRLEKIDADFLLKSESLMGFAITQDDLCCLSQTYGQLGRHLHLPKEPFLHPDQEVWKDDLEELVLDAYKYLCELTGQDPG